MIENYVIYIRLSQASVLIPLLVGGLRYRRLGSFQRLLWLLVLASALTEGIASVMSLPHNDLNNLPVYNTYAILFMGFTNRLFAQLLKTTWLNRFWNLPLIAMLLLALVNAFFLQPFDAFQSNFISASFALNTLFSFLYFVRLLKRLDQFSGLSQPGFWFSCGLFMYCSSTVLLFTFINEHLVNYEHAILSPWGLNALLFALLNIFSTLALWMHPPE